MVAGHLHFRKRGIKLVDLKATDLQDFYTNQLERIKANSVIHALTEIAEGGAASPDIQPTVIFCQKSTGDQST